ncbi:MAG: hypothetical protein HZA31_10240 [Opitutae bacterium]|nr:hypothetical protein [Opitutae bacterium]
MFAKTIELTATKKEFRFTCGMNETRFRPVVYLSPERRVLSVGSPPAEGGTCTEARVFDDESFDDSFSVLEVMMRYGARAVIGGFSFGTITFRISIGPDIRKDLMGFTNGLFTQAATHAGASKVVIV